MTLPDRIDVDPHRAVAEGVFHVREGADYLADHFPGAPMLPGLLMLQVAVDAAAALWAETTLHSPMAAVLERVDRLTVVRRIVPGETLVVLTQPVGTDDDPATAWFSAVGTVSGETAMRAKFQLRAVLGADQRRGEHGE